MNMIDAVKSVLSQYVGFNGRARRSEYWFWTLATIIVAFLAVIIELALGLGTDGSGPISSLFNIAIFVPGLAVTFRRLHDIGRSGWWVGGFYLGLLVSVILILVVFGTTAGDSTSIGLIGIFGIMLILGIFIYAIVMLIFMCTDSQSGPNKYGPNPKNHSNYDVFE